MTNYRFWGALIVGVILSHFVLKAQDNSAFTKSEIQILFEGKTGDHSVCYRIPALAVAPNGDLIAAIDQRHDSCGDLKWNRNINITIRKSSDGGKTWSNAETIVDYPDGQSASDPSIIVDNASGQVFLFFNFMDLDREKEIYYHYVTVSQDNGQTWSEPKDITPEITLPEWHNDFKFITSGRGIVTSTGQLLHTLVNLQRGVTLFGSNDSGKSWFVGASAVNPADESQLIEAKDETIVMNSRVNGAGIRYIHTTSDNGATWESRPDSSLVDPGCNAGLIKNETGKWFFSNLKSQKDRRRLMIQTSDNEGKTWKEMTTVYPGSSAYSSMTLLPDQTIGLLFELDDYSKVGFVKLKTESW